MDSVLHRKPCRRANYGVSGMIRSAGTVCSGDGRGGGGMTAIITEKETEAAVRSGGRRWHITATLRQSCLALRHCQQTAPACTAIASIRGGGVTSYVHVWVVWPRCPAPSSVFAARSRRVGQTKTWLVPAGRRRAQTSGRDAGDGAGCRAAPAGLGRSVTARWGVPDRPDWPWQRAMPAAFCTSPCKVCNSCSQGRG